MSTSIQMKVAYIGAGATLVAALITGLFTLLGDKPEPRTSPLDGSQTKIQQAKRMLGEEVLTNLLHLDTRLGFIHTQLQPDPFEDRLQRLRREVAPALEQAGERGYRQLIGQQTVADLRATFNTYPLRLDQGDPLFGTLLESDTSPEVMRNFYDQLGEAHAASESLLHALSPRLSSSTVDAPETNDYQLRRIDLELEIVNTRYLAAHLAGLRLLNELGNAMPDARARLAVLTQLEPRQPLGEAEQQDQTASLAKHSAELVLQRLELMREGERLRDQTLKSYRQLNQQLVVNSTDTWSAVVAKAISLRQLGRIPEAVAAFDRYGEMFVKTDPGAPRYARTAQQFTLQLEDLGVQGGVYIHEVVKGGEAGKAGLQVGDIVIDYAGHLITDMNAMVSGLRDAPAGDPLRLVYLRMNDAGVFKRRTASVRGGPLGAGYMPI